MSLPQSSSDSCCAVSGSCTHPLIQQHASYPPDLSVSTLPAIAKTVETHLRRQLSLEEHRVIHRLSPQGIAKLNRDVIRGVPMERVLAELKAAYHTMVFQRKMMEIYLTSKTKKMIAKMGRPVSVGELIFLSRCRQKTLSSAVQRRTKQGEEFADIIEDLVIQHVDEHQLGLAKVLSTTFADPAKPDSPICPNANPPEKETPEASVLPVSVIHLAPTEYHPPKSDSNGDRIDPHHPTLECFNHVIRVESDKIRIGLSPVMAWFSHPQPTSPASQTGVGVDEISAIECRSVPTLPTCTSTGENELTPRSRQPKNRKSSPMGVRFTLPHEMPQTVVTAVVENSTRPSRRLSADLFSFATVPGCSILPLLTLRSESCTSWIDGYKGWVFTPLMGLPSLLTSALFIRLPKILVSGTADLLHLHRSI